MPYTNFPAGITSFGVPTFGVGPELPTGQIFFVSSVTGGAGNYAQNSPTNPLATIAQALTAITQPGSYIYCLPGHAETISGAAGIALNVAGVTIVGLGNGFAKPTITFTTATAAQMTITGANTVITNFNFISNFAAIVALVSVTAKGVQFQGCNFYTAIASTVPLISILTTTAADDLVINGCKFYYLQSLASTAGTPAATEVVRLVGTDRVQITNSYFGCDCSTTAINNVTTAGLEINISNCFINNPHNSTSNFIQMVATSSGIISNVQGYTGDSTTAHIGTIILSTAASGVAIDQCYATNAVAGKTAGAFIGVVST
jgi:hypothetical protein